MTADRDIRIEAGSNWCKAEAPWWERHAVAAINRGHWWTIYRKPEDVYLARFWLSEPVIKTNVAPGDCPFDVEDSVLLHLFLRPDDDSALHDHPAPFTTTILAGSYEEARPPADWREEHGGPAPRSNLIEYPTGAMLHRKAEDLHAVSRLLTPRVWTLVRMGTRERSWGFWPEGKNWMPADDYLAGPP